MRGATSAAVRDDWDATAFAAAHVLMSQAPGVVADGDGSIVTANAAAQPMIRRGELPSVLRALAIDVRFKNCLQTTRVSLQVDGTPRCFELMLMPLSLGHVLIAGRDATLEANLLTALGASRDLFRDLAVNFTDFAFETDAGGVFSWVSPGGLLGYSAGELHGVRPRDLFVGADASSFSGRSRVTAHEIWVAAKSGAESCLALTASPVFDQAGTWRGTRGVARDVTALRVLEREAAQAKKREDLINAIVGAVRAQIEPRRMMLAAADALAAATDADAVTIQAYGTGMSVSVGRKGPGLVHGFDLATSHQEAANGSVRLVREGAKGPFCAAAKALVDAVAPHLGVALALVQMLETANPTRRDAATGLLTRRAFMAEARRRHAAAVRAGRELTIVVFDCDDFEDVMGAPGQSMNEEALAVVGRTLATRCGSGDLTGMLDEDEFALITDWAADPLGAAEAVRNELAAAGRAVCGGVSISAGCVISAPHADETLEDLFARADCALHSAKREGPNRIALAETLQQVTRCSNG